MADATFSFLDYDGETSTTTVHTGAVTAVSLPGLLTQFGALRTAMDALSVATISNEALNVFSTKLSNVKPTDENAQRERKWLVFYEDSQQFFDPGVNAIPNAGYKKVFHHEIPGALIDGQLLANTDIADLSTAAWIAYKDAFEDIGRSPYGGTVTLLSAEVVGRNL